MWLAALFLAPFLGSLLVDQLSRKEYVVAETGVIVISGASSGIGRHAAINLAEKGYVVFAGVRKETDANSIRNLQIKGLYPVILDVTKHDSCVTAFQSVKQFSEENKLPIVALVNNAGVSRKMPAEIHHLDDIRRVFDTNFFGMIDLTQIFIPALRESKGRIVMISSLSGLVATPTSSVYASSKFAMEGFSDGLRRELNSFGISVSIVEPGYVKSSIFATSAEESTLTAEQEEVAGRHYQRYYDAKAKEKREKQLSMADEPTVTSSAILHAISSKYPKTRYPVANADGIPALAVDWIRWMLPARVMDRMMGAA